MQKVLALACIAALLSGCGGAGEKETAVPPVIDTPENPDNTSGNGSSPQTPVLNLTEVATTNGMLVGGPDSASSGYTLYTFDNDFGSTSQCTGNCAVNWPPLIVTDGTASGIDELGVIARGAGSLQATFNGKPLYFYSGDTAAGQQSGHGQGGAWHRISYGLASLVVPLYNASTTLEPVIQFDRGDALVTRISDRGRDRHAREDQFQSYDHFLPFYWENRSASIEIIDYVAKGGTQITMNMRTQFPLESTNNRWFYRGIGTVAEYHDNGGMDLIGENLYTKTRSYHYAEQRQIRIGDRLEFEPSQFLDVSIPRGRKNYYGTTYLYIVGEGLVPWYTAGTFEDQTSEKEDSRKIPEKAWLGGHTTLAYNFSNEPDNHFMQMATNLGYDNAQPFLLGRRLHHTSFVDGSHDESGNPAFTEMANKAGPHYVNTKCTVCHKRNGRASPAALGESLNKWVFKVADINGLADPDLGHVLQMATRNGAITEGNVSLSSWTEVNGLRSPNYQFSGKTPARFSGRIAPALVGMGLLEAIPEETILALADENDLNNDGISGKANIVKDPETGELRLGRFGWKAATVSVKHQVTAALNTDIGVMTSMMPHPDCGANQTDCGASGSELGDAELEQLVKYNSLLGVRPQRNYDSAQVVAGQALFSETGCASCHTPTFVTSEHHPLAELRSQTIHPYTDMLLHDMGAGLADNLGEGEASGSEWRTTPLWGIGLSACVTGGVVNPQGGQGNEVCAPDHSYLHDGRARSIGEAILWHGGEGQASKNAYVALTSQEQAAVLAFLNSL